MKLNIYLIIILITSSFSVFSHEIKMENKKIEEIVKLRMNNMSVISSLSKKIYSNLKKEDFEKTKIRTLELKHNVLEFKELFPEGSIGGKSKKSIWEEKELFDKYISIFLNDIDSFIKSIDNKDLASSNADFNNLTSNCGSCHKKFKSK